MMRYQLVGFDPTLITSGGFPSVAVHVDIEWVAPPSGWRATDDLGGFTQGDGSKPGIVVALEQLANRLVPASALTLAAAKLADLELVTARAATLGTWLETRIAFCQSFIDNRDANAANMLALRAAKVERDTLRVVRDILNGVQKPLEHG